MVWEHARPRAQRIEHDLRVVGLEQVMNQRAALAQAGEQQYPVGNAL